MAQAPGPEAGDCMGAIAITDSIIVCDRPSRSFGNILEIKENPPADLKWLEREHNTAWYRFRAPVKTTLTFDIIPANEDDDIDFLLFEGNIPGVCEKIQTKEVVPIRSNISRNDPELNSRCGLSKDGTEDYVRSGVGSSYSRALEVEEGDLYYLLVDYPQRPRDGFTLHFHYDPPPPPAKELPQTLIVEVVDSITGTPLDAAITVEGMVFDSVVKGKGSSRYEFKMDNYRTLRINCLRKDYMFRAVHIKGSGAEVLHVKLQLVPIAPDTKVVLEDIRFVGNDSKVLRSSEASLYMLLHFLEENPGTNIEVQGHVNGPSVKRNNPELLALSQARAQAVYNFLVINDIDPARLSYVGMGNAYMLYPNPRNTKESEANRRVEVRVTGHGELATPSAPASSRSSN